MNERKDYRVTVKVRNNNLLRAIAEAGHEPGQKFAEIVGANYASLNDLINMTRSPLAARTGEPLPWVDRLCAFLNKPFRELFCDEQLTALETNKAERELAPKQLKQLISNFEQADPIRALEMESAFKRLNMDRLSGRGQEVLRMRFGFDGPEMTLVEVAEHFGVTQERIRQIEAKALRQLRHPSNREGVDYSTEFA